MSIYMAQSEDSDLESKLFSVINISTGIPISLGNNGMSSPSERVIMLFDEKKTVHGEHQFESQLDYSLIHTSVEFTSYLFSPLYSS